MQHTGLGLSRMCSHSYRCVIVFILVFGIQARVRSVVVSTAKLAVTGAAVDASPLNQDLTNVYATHTHVLSFSHAVSLPHCLSPTLVHSCTLPASAPLRTGLTSASTPNVTTRPATSVGLEGTTHTPRRKPGQTKIPAKVAVSQPSPPKPSGRSPHSASKTRGTDARMQSKSAERSTKKRSDRKDGGEGKPPSTPTRQCSILCSQGAWSCMFNLPSPLPLSSPLHLRTSSSPLLLSSSPCLPPPFTFSPFPLPSLCSSLLSLSLPSLLSTLLHSSLSSTLPPHPLSSLLSSQ